MIKQIKDLSAATIDDLNDNCQFVMDDSNDKTKKVSFGTLKDKITDGIDTGVSKIIAGDNVTIEPSPGIGNVKISCSGGGEGSILMPDYKNQIFINSGGTAPENCIFIAYNDNNGMTIYGMLKYIYENPGSKVTHRLFLSGEYIFYDKNTDSIRDEENNLFEDWKETDYSYNGILTRCTPVWQDGWSLYDINITH